MKIELATPTTVKISWPEYDAGTNDELLKRLNTVPGVEGFGRRYYAPAIQVARLMQLFPKASYDYAAMQAADAQIQAFYDSLAQFGIVLAIEPTGSIVAFGETVSPLIQTLVDERAPALRALVLEAMRNPTKAKTLTVTVLPLHGPLTADDARLEPLLKGIANAKRKAEDEVKYPQRRRKVKP